MSLLSQHKDEHYAKELEKILLVGLKEDKIIFNFLKEHVVPIYLIACEESNYKIIKKIRDTYGEPILHDQYTGNILHDQYTGKEYLPGYHPDD